MNRLRLSVEVLDARALPSAFLASADAMTTDLDAPTTDVVQYAGESSESTSADGTYQDDSGVTTAEKVTFQDFHFVAKMSKSSPT